MCDDVQGICKSNYLFVRHTMVVQVRAGRDTPMCDDVQGICKSNYLFVRHAMVVQVGAGRDTPMCDDVQGNVKVITFSCVIRW